MEDAEIAVLLRRAQAAYSKDVSRATRVRQDACAIAKAAGWSPYRIATEIGVAPGTVRAVLDSVSRRTVEEES